MRCSTFATLDFIRVPLPAAITTTFSAMPQFLIKSLIIGVLLGCLSGCSALRLAYNNGALAAWWWLDGYVDFSREQTPQAKAAIDQWFAWNRRTQLLDYAAHVAAARSEVLDAATPAQACQWQKRLREAAEPALEQALQLGADLVPGLGEPQWRYLQERFEKKNDEMRRDFLQPDADDRQQAAVKRVLERAEMLYGRLDEAQKRVIAAGVAASPFDAQAWLGERQRRQRETVQTLRRLAVERADHDHIVVALRQLVDHAEKSPDAPYRVYQARLADYNCAFAAQVHNSTTPAQRQAAREQLKTWEDDLRALAAAKPPNGH